MTAWNAAPMNWRKLTVEPHKQMRRCHDRNIHGLLRPMDDGYCPLFKVWVVVFGAIGVAIWAMPSAPAFAPSASSQQAVSTADAASIRIAKGK